MSITDLPDLALIKIIEDIDLRDRIILENQVHKCSRLLKILNKFWKQEKRLCCKDLTIQGNILGLTFVEFALKRIGDCLQSIDFSECQFRTIDLSQDIDPISITIPSCFLQGLTCDKYPHLEEVILRGCPLQADSVLALSKMVNVTVLDIRSCFPYPSDDYDWDCVDCALQEVFQHCVHLQVLYFTFSFACSALKSIPTTLHTLYLQQDRIDAPVGFDINIVHRLSNLQTLKLGVHLDTSLALQSLAVHNSLLVHLDLRKVYTLDSSFPVSGMSELNRFEKLESLSLNFYYENGSISTEAITCITDSGLVNTLTNLRLWRCRAQKETLVKLALLTNLQQLDLLRCDKLHMLEVDGTCNNFYKSLPNLKSLSVVGTKVTDITLMSIAQCCALNTLDARLCLNITENGLGQMDRIRTNRLCIYICGTQMTDGKRRKDLTEQIQHWHIFFQHLKIDPFSWPKWK